MVSKKLQKYYNFKIKPIFANKVHKVFLEIKLNKNKSTGTHSTQLPPPSEITMLLVN